MKQIGFAFPALSAAVFYWWALLPQTAGAQVLKAVKDRGTLNCGASEGLYGFLRP